MEHVRLVAGQPRRHAALVELVEADGTGAREVLVVEEVRVVGDSAGLGSELKK